MHVVRVFPTSCETSLFLLLANMCEFYANRRKEDAARTQIKFD